MLFRLIKTYFFVIFLTFIVCLRVNAEDFNGTINGVNVKSAGGNSVVVDVYVNSKDPKLKPKLSTRKYKGDKYVIDLMNVTQAGGVQKDTSSANGLINNKDVKVGKVSGGTARVLIDLPTSNVNVKEVRYHVISDKDKMPASKNNKDKNDLNNKNTKATAKTDKKKVANLVAAKPKPKESQKKPPEKQKAASVKPKTTTATAKTKATPKPSSETPKPTVEKIVDKNKTTTVASPMVVHKTSNKETATTAKNPTPPNPQVIKTTEKPKAATKKAAPKPAVPPNKSGEIAKKPAETTKKITNNLAPKPKPEGPFSDVQSKVYLKPKKPVDKKVAENKVNQPTRPEIKVPDMQKKEPPKPKMVQAKPAPTQPQVSKPASNKPMLASNSKELAKPKTLETKPQQNTPTADKTEQNKTNNLITPQQKQLKTESTTETALKSTQKTATTQPAKSTNNVEQVPINLNTEEIRQIKDYTNEKDKKSDMTSTFFTLIGALVIVIPLIALTAWVIKQIHKGGNPLAGFSKLPGLSSSKFNIISSISLGQGRSIHLVEIKDRQLVIGCTNNNITILTEFSDYDNFVEGKEEPVKESAKQVTESNLKYKKGRPPLGSFADLYKDYKNKVDEKDLEDEY